MFLSIILQTVCVIAAGYALWRLWAVIARRGRLISLIVAAGFAGRSLAGQLLFWVSYLKLPYGRSLQLGDGLWFFGLDALLYYGVARTAAYRGLWAALTINPGEPSFMYVKAVALFLWLFGTVTSTAILLNLASYLGTAALIVVWGERRRVDPRIVALTLAAVSLLPSAILWALQPLKDAFVVFLAVLFAFMVDGLVAAWRAEGRVRLVRIAFSAAVLPATTYSLAGIRWYYALILLAAASIPLLAIVATGRGGRAIAVRATAMLVLMLVLTQSVVAGAYKYLPAGMRAVLRPWSDRGGIAQRIDRVEDAVTVSRDNFDRYTAAGTRIRAGSAAAQEEPPPPAAATPPPVTSTGPAAVVQPPATETAAPPRVAVTTTNPTPKEASPHPAQATATSAEPSAPNVPAASPAVAAPVHAPAAAPVPPPAPALGEAPVTAPVKAPVAEPVKAPVAAPVKAPVAAPVKVPVAAPVQPFVPAAVQAAPAPPPQQQADVPATATGRLITGLAALLLPRKVGSALGLVSIGGGRGLMWFVDLDTILFDVVMIACAVVFFIGLRRGAWRDAFLWYLVVATIVITSALAYTVSNYGTLFRHRQMVVATLALIGIAAARPRPDAPRSGEAA